MNAAQAHAVSAFAQLASGFCAWCEGTSLGEDCEASAAGWLARLYAAAIDLPSRGPENAGEPPTIPAEQLERARRNLSQFRGKHYREFFDPDPSLRGEPVVGDVGDDLLDTYTDVRSGLICFDRARLEEALWYWSYLHRIHWGRHAVGAMFALHCVSVARRP